MDKLGTMDNLRGSFDVLKADLTTSMKQCQQTSDVKYDPNVEIKEEIREEALEAPIADTVNFCNSSLDAAASSSRRKHNFRESTSPSEHSPGAIITSPDFNCPICKEHVRDGRLEVHARNYHKENWLEFVQKCSEENCDFRSAYPDVVNRHYMAVHTHAFHRRKPMMHFLFPPGTRCPYCDKSIASLSSFVRHMESDHKRLCTYEKKILICAVCRHTVANTYEMLAHWAKKSLMCAKGIQFNYIVAKQTLFTDNIKSAKERGEGNDFA